MYTITKHFEFCYAHRLHNYPGKCGNIHGHTAKIEVACSVNELHENGMGIDFKELGSKIGGWIDKNLDHRIILERTDPALLKLKEIDEDICELETPPSAENIAKLIYENAKSLGFPVTAVSFWESPDSVATYKA